jgi:hypothetical protein
MADTKELALLRAVYAYLRATERDRKTPIRGRFAQVVADPEVRLACALQGVLQDLHTLTLQYFKGERGSDCTSEVAEPPSPPHPELP